MGVPPQQDKLRSGWVATSLPDGASASAHDLAGRKFSGPRTWLTPELLVAEVRDTIDQLNGRPGVTAPLRPRRHGPQGRATAGLGGRSRRPHAELARRACHAGGVRRGRLLLRGTGSVDRGAALPDPGRRTGDLARSRGQAEPLVSAGASGRPGRAWPARRLPRPGRRRGGRLSVRRPCLLGAVGRRPHGPGRGREGGHGRRGAQARRRGTASGGLGTGPYRRHGRCCRTGGTAGTTVVVGD